MNLKVIVVIAIVGVALTGLSVFYCGESILQITFTAESNVFSKLAMMQTDGVKHLISLDRIKGGGLPKDGIPSIGNPVFADVQSFKFMSDSDTVIGLDINGEVKAYPIFILVWHEIVNDNVGGILVSVTYCPLCYTNQVFERIID